MNYNETQINHYQGLGSRKIVGKTLASLAKENDTIMAVYADVGSRFGLNDSMPFCIETGIAEASLVGILSGMAHEQLIPFGIAYAPFLVYRALDQIRMSVGEMNLPIKLVGGSAGLISANLGAASMAIDDISVMRSVPNINIESPADCLEVAKTLEEVSKIDKPFYIRVTGGNTVNPIHKHDYEFMIGKNEVLYSGGKDAVIFCSGTITAEVIEAANMLALESILVTVVNVHTIVPFDSSVIQQYVDTSLFVTVEEHNIIGGLGSIIAEALFEHNAKAPLIKIGVEGCYPVPDSYENVMSTLGLGSKNIFERVYRYFRKDFKNELLC